MFYKYISLNAFEHIALHDCVIDEGILLNDKVKLKFDNINVLFSHPLNYFNRSKRTGKAAIIFEKCTVQKSFASDGSNVNEKKVTNVSDDGIIMESEFNTLTKDMEILQVKIDTSIENMLQYKFIGLNYDGSGVQFVLKFEKLIICWNRFEEDAWPASWGR
ncbi:hypothetical protein [Clostridium folliculivorans]|uniref:Uncharacterized protein n=1 Tax=Clostridium folliculivorans TaxID=2886038 RepID=A0A9W5Y255_9CLOT|nr:hypothetical protein [Clostridium folliculivorans]GKU25210.1 hypothetical protein CFOLD11_20360 [Clostridium folliculivorans]GKU31308.1 hypothetical protein CFB3_34150 [Clostridium folliculivorans]